MGSIFMISYIVRLQLRIRGSFWGGLLERGAGLRMGVVRLEGLNLATKVIKTFVYFYISYHSWTWLLLYRKTIEIHSFRYVKWIISTNQIIIENQTSWDLIPLCGQRCYNPWPWAIIFWKFNLLTKTYGKFCNRLLAGIINF